MTYNQTEIVVSIHCLAYNQEAFICKCLDGFVMQKTNFRFEAIVHDDASTDRTSDIIREYAEKYSDIIKPIFETENQYSKGGGLLQRIMDENTHGKYIAICEGDDYWTDPLKLQKQVDFLESNPDYGMCYTKSFKLYKNKKRGIWGDEDCSFAGLIDFKIIPTLSRLDRRSIYEQYLVEINPYEREWCMGDFPVVLYYAIKSKIHLINEITCVYRVTDNSASHSKDINKLLFFYDKADAIRYFFINKYIKDNNERNSLLQLVKKNEINYKINLYIQYNDYENAKRIYISEGHNLCEDERKRFGMATRSLFLFKMYKVQRLLKKVYKKIK